MTNSYILRFSTAAIGAAFLTLALFYLMVILITQEFKMPVVTKGITLTFVKPVEMALVQKKDPKIVKPIPPVTPPQPPMKTKMTQSGVPGLHQKITEPTDGDGHEMLFELIDGGMLPLVSVQPNYPRRAAERGIEGYTIVEFDVSAQGLVKSPRVIEHQPNSMFDAASLKAIRKFKYKPEVINGIAVSKGGVMKRFTFELKQY